MKPLLCPQCGGSIANYSEVDRFATCRYCSTRFLIEEATPAEDEDELIATRRQTHIPKEPQHLFIAVGAVIFLFGGLILYAVFSAVAKPDPPRLLYPTPSWSPISFPTSSPAPSPEPNILSFGGTGTGDGLFTDASSIAVDNAGRIFVSDGTMRIQQFDTSGNFVRVWEVPSKTSNYSRARQINKIAAGNDNRIYVAVGGVILVYAQNASEPSQTLHVAPDYVQDFALKSDGGLLMVSNNEEIETLHFVNRAGKVTQRIVGFHTEPADPTMSPSSTGVVAIRIAVDGVGNIFSVYALGDLGSYELNHNSEEFLIYRFTPQGKYVNKFVPTMKSCGIAVDDQSRIYISDDNAINIYNARGEFVSAVTDLNRISSFALDKGNNVYALLGDTVVKRAALARE
jgi:hypothetical protein